MSVRVPVNLTWSSEPPAPIRTPSAPAVEWTVRDFSRLNIVVVNAGIVIMGRADEFSLDDFDRMVATNVRGVFAGMHFSAPHLEAGGRIITIGSDTADRTAFPRASVYAMTDDGGPRLTLASPRGLVAETSRYGGPDGTGYRDPKRFLASSVNGM